MKTLLLLIISMISINQANWQDESITEWNIALANQGYSQWDNYVPSNIGEEILYTHQLCEYVFEMDKILNSGCLNKDNLPK